MDFVLYLSLTIVFSPGTTYLYSDSGPYSWTRMHHSALAKLRQFGDRVREDIVPGVTLLYLFRAEDIKTLFLNEASQFLFDSFSASFSVF